MTDEATTLGDLEGTLSPLFTEDDMARTTIADTPAPKKRGRPPGPRKSRVPPPDQQPPPKPGQPKLTPAQIEAAKRARIKRREAEIRTLITDTVNPLLLQGAAMIVPPVMLFQVQPTPDQTGLQIVVDSKTQLPVPTEIGASFYVNQLETQIVAMTGARLEELPFAGQVGRLMEAALPYALCGGLVLAAGMYGRRAIGTLGQLRAASQTRVVEVPPDAPGQAAAQ